MANYMIHANSSAYAAAKARAIEGLESAARGSHHGRRAARTGGRGMLPVSRRGDGYRGHSCSAGSKNYREFSRASAGLLVHESLRLGASLALDGRLAEVLHERQAPARAAVNFLICSRHGSS